MSTKAPDRRHAVSTNDPKTCTWHVWHRDNKSFNHCIHCGDPIENHRFVLPPAPEAPIDMSKFF